MRIFPCVNFSPSTYTSYAYSDSAKQLSVFVWSRERVVSLNVFLIIAKMMTASIVVARKFFKRKKTHIHTKIHRKHFDDFHILLGGCLNRSQLDLKISSWSCLYTIISIRFTCLSRIYCLARRVCCKFMLPLFVLNDNEKRAR